MCQTIYVYNTNNEIEREIETVEELVDEFETFPISLALSKGFKSLDLKSCLCQINIEETLKCIPDITITKKNGYDYVVKKKSTVP